MGRHQAEDFSTGDGAKTTLRTSHDLSPSPSASPFRIRDHGQLLALGPLLIVGLLWSLDTEAATRPQLGSTAGVSRVPPVRVEYSNVADERALPFWGGQDTPDPGQMLYTQARIRLRRRATPVGSRS